MAVFQGSTADKQTLKSDFWYKVTRYVEATCMEPTDAAVDATGGLASSSYIDASFGIDPTSWSMIDGTQLQTAAQLALREYTKVRKRKFQFIVDGAVVTPGEYQVFVLPHTSTDATKISQIEGNLVGKPEWNALNAGVELSYDAVNKFINKCQSVWQAVCLSEPPDSESTNINLCHANHSSHGNHGSRGRR